jgi:hypothetical protein
MAKQVWAYDIETFPNVFTFAAGDCNGIDSVVFEISERKNESKELVKWLMDFCVDNGTLVGYNNLGFDYPVIHMLIKMGTATAKILYDKAMSIVTATDNDRFRHTVWPSDRYVTQLDLYKIHHFDNNARATSLKTLEFNMRSKTIVECPLEFGTEIHGSDIDVLINYNIHDVHNTIKFYHKTKEMISFREELTKKYSHDFMNHNDTKIGKDFFTMKLIEAGVECYEYGKHGRKVKQTINPILDLNKAIFPWIKFKTDSFNTVLNYIREQKITETKGVFDKLAAMLGTLDLGFKFEFGTGGIHGSIKNEVIESNDEYEIIDVDVKSFYPNLAIKWNLYPAHLGETFVGIYSDLYTQRSSYKKGTAENAMLKLALNGVYGDSNNPYSVFYDSMFTMKITLNGQMLLCLLAEELYAITGTRLLQCNTDGITIRSLRADREKVESVCKAWEQITKLELEYANYSLMSIRDVNNYIAVCVDGKVKRKGVYEYKKEWHQNHSSMVIAKVAEKAIVQGVNIREALHAHEDIMDFMILVKAPKNSMLSYSNKSGGLDFKVQNVTRYIVSKNGVTLTKHMPPTKTKPDKWRTFNVESGYTVQICNDVKDIDKSSIDYDYYANEVEKLVLAMK